MAFKKRTMICASASLYPVIILFYFFLEAIKILLKFLYSQKKGQLGALMLRMLKGLLDFVNVVV